MFGGTSNPQATTFLISRQRLNINEYFAVALDEYFCRAESRKRQQIWYPQLYNYMQNQFISDLKQFLVTKTGDSDSSGSSSSSGSTSSGSGRSCPKTPPDAYFQCQNPSGCEAYTDIVSKEKLMCAKGPCLLKSGNRSQVLRHACSKKTGTIWYEFEITFNGKNLNVWAESRTRW